MYAGFDEIAALCRVVAEEGGYYCPHHRNYGADALGGYGECLEVARATGVALHLAHTHLSFPVNEGRLDELLGAFEDAVAAGVDLSFDSYPYLAGMTSLHACLPSWVQQGEVDEQLARLRNPAVRERLRVELDITGTDGNQGLPVDWDTIVVSACPAEVGYADLIGRSMAHGARSRGVRPSDLFLDVVIASRMSASCVMHFGIEDHVRRLMQHPRHMVGSDGILVGDKPHPRAWGAFARMLGRYVREEGMLTLAECIRHMTSAPADRLGLGDRGRVTVGAWADLVVFNPHTVLDRATYDSPRQPPVGIRPRAGQRRSGGARRRSHGPPRRPRPPKPGPERKEIMNQQMLLEAAHSEALFPLVDDVDTPALLVDLDVLERNVDEMAALCRDAGVSLLPHAKTHRTPAIGLMQVARGAQGLCTATLDEAEAFAAAGIERLLIAYPLAGELKFTRASRLAERTNLEVATDGIDAGQAIGAHFAGRGQSVDVGLLVDSGLGREGVALSDVVPVGRELARTPGIRLTSLITHEGQVYGATDRDDLESRVRTVATAMAGAADALRASGVQRPRVSVGASASARLMVRQPGIDEVRPGIYAFNDLGQIALGNATARTCAVRVLTTVVSHPEPGRACIDAGSKSLGRDGLPATGVPWQGFGLIADRPDWRIHALSEEHGWLRWMGAGEPTPLRVGEQLQVIPNHVCLTFYNLAASIPLRGGRVQGMWSTLGRPGRPRSSSEDCSRPARASTRESGEPSVALLGQPASMPPSITSSEPVMNDASSEARYSAAAAISAGVPRRPSGWRATSAARAESGSSAASRSRPTHGESTVPGRRSSPARRCRRTARQPAS